MNRILALAALLTLFMATTASAQVCSALHLTTQAQVDAVSCSSVTGDVSIGGSDITNLDGLGAVTSVGGDLDISYNSVLTNVDGLAALTSVGGYLHIQDNWVLTNVDGLGAVTSVGGDLWIYDSFVLTNVDGLGAVTSVGRDLWIDGNSVLDNFCGIFPLLDASGLVGTYTVTNNATNPTEADILAGGACLVPPVPSLNPFAIAILCTLLGLAGLRRLRG
jgi:hypothetical protein